MRTSVNTEERLTPEDVAKYLARSRQYRMAAAVRELEAKAHELSRQFHDLLLENSRLRTQLNPPTPTSRQTSCKSEWD